MWASILRHYEQNGRQRAKQELAWFGSQASLAAAIRNAALAVNDRGKRFSHQRRVPRSQLEEGHRRLGERESAIRKAMDFDSLLRLVEEAVDGVRGLGELWCYDTALRIGAFLGLEPMVVYLHAGTRIGARALGFDAHADAIKVDLLPPDLKGLSPREVEDVLCIYKSKLQRDHNDI